MSLKCHPTAVDLAGRLGAVCVARVIRGEGAVALYEWFGWFPSTKVGQDLLLDNALLAGISGYLLWPRSYRYKNVFIARLIFIGILFSALAPLNVLLYFKIIPEYIPLLNGWYWSMLAFVVIFYIKIFMDAVNQQYKIRRTDEEVKALFRCPRCGHQNGIGKNFCGECGAKLKE
jgi:hypothetical protein